MICLVLSADNIKRISITYDYISDNSHESAEQAKKTAVQQAKLKALEKEFGLDVIGINSVLQRNSQEGETATTTSEFFSISETSVRGEWIETISEKILDAKFEKGFWHVRVAITGRARNKSSEKPAVQYALINNVHDRHPRDQYYDGDDIFLRFTSPVSGALCVYLVDAEQKAYCLLPYLSSEIGYQPVEANKEYLFFSSATDALADEYTLNCQKSSEHNEIYVIFSPNQFTKAVDQQAGKNWRDEPLPRQLSYADFFKWLSQIQVRDGNMVVHREVVSIRK